MLRLPPKSADAPLTRGDVGDDRGTAAHAVAVSIDGIFERQQRLVGNGFDQPCAEERNRHATSDDRGVGRE